MHYGEALIDELKKGHQYGSFFSYTEYQTLHCSASLAELAAVIRSTKYADCLVCADVGILYQEIRLTERLHELSSRLEDESFWRSRWFSGEFVMFFPLNVMGWHSTRESLAEQIEEVQNELARLRSEQTNKDAQTPP